MNPVLTSSPFAPSVLPPSFAQPEEPASLGASLFKTIASTLHEATQPGRISAPNLGLKAECNFFELARLLHASQLQVSSFKLTGGTLTHALLGEPANNDLDFLGILPIVPEHLEAVRSALLDALEKSMGLTKRENGQETIYSFNRRVIGKVAQNDPEKRKFFIEEYQIIEPVVCDNSHLSTKLQVEIGGKTQSIDMTLLWGDVPQCTNSSNCFQWDMLPAGLDPNALNQIEAAPGYDLCADYELLQKRLFRIYDPHIPLMRSALPNYVHTLTKGIRPVDYRWEPPLLLKWSDERKYLSQEKCFARLRTYIGKHYSNANLALAYLINFYSFFSSCEFQKNKEFLEELDSFIVTIIRKTPAKDDSDSKEEPLNPAHLRAASFWGRVGDFPLQHRYDCPGEKHPSHLSFHFAGSKWVFALPPWRETLDLLTKPSALVPFLGKTGLPKTLEAAQKLVRARAKALSIDQKAWLFQHLISGPKDFSAFFSLFISILPKLDEEDFKQIAASLAAGDHPQYAGWVSNLPSRIEQFLASFPPNDHPSRARIVSPYVFIQAVITEGGSAEKNLATETLKSLCQEARSELELQAALQVVPKKLYPVLRDTIFDQQSPLALDFPSLLRKMYL